jgi:lysophospholipase L1-like esterase
MGTRTDRERIRTSRADRLSASALFLAVLILVCISAGCAADTNDPGEFWVATWGASPFAFQTFGPSAPAPVYENQTLRQVVRISVGGNRLRVRFSNEIGETPLKIGGASIALVDAEDAVKEDSLKKLTFGGMDSITVPPGAPALSDAIDFKVGSLAELAVSMYLPERTPASTVHMGRTAFVSSTGDFTGSAKLQDPKKSTTQAFLTGIYTATSQEAGAIVALGDSITDGTASTPYTFSSWPHDLAQLLAERTGKHRDMAVVNEGIAGNQLLRNGAGDCTLCRFDRDVLATPGLTHVVVLIGINDIGTGGMTFPGASGPAPALRAPEDLIAGYRQLIARAHSMSPPVKIYGATLTPFEGAMAGYYTPEKDKVRVAVNEWIRTSGEFDAVIDFDKAVQDPANPMRMAPEYNSGDNLHPGDAGYRKMAESVDLALFE